MRQQQAASCVSWQHGLMWLLCPAPVTSDGPGLQQHSMSQHITAQHHSLSGNARAQHGIWQCRCSQICALEHRTVHIGSALHGGTDDRHTMARLTKCPLGPPGRRKDHCLCPAGVLCNLSGMPKMSAVLIRRLRRCLPPVCDTPSATAYRITTCSATATATAMTRLFEQQQQQQQHCCGSTSASTTACHKPDKRGQFLWHLVGARDMWPAACSTAGDHALAVCSARVQDSAKP